MNAESQLSIGRLFDLAWQDVKNNLPLVAALSFVFLLATQAFGYTPILGILAAPLWPGYLRCLQKISKAEAVDFADFFWGYRDFNRLLQFVLLSILYTVLVVVGLLALIIPGVWLSVALVLSLHVACSQNEPDAVAAIKGSMKIVKGRWWWTLGLMFVILFLNVLGGMFFLIGLLVSAPLSVLMLWHYVQIAQSPEPLPAVANAGTGSGTESILQVNPQ